MSDSKVEGTSEDSQSIDTAEVTVPSDNSSIQVNGSSVTENPATPSGNTRSQSKICGVCNTNESKYKCSRCEVPYCSVACSTLHRATHPTTAEGASHTSIESKPPTSPDEEAKSLSSHSVLLKGTPDAFAVLKSSPELHALFSRYPGLRSQLRDIHSATLPPAEDSLGATGQFQGYRQNLPGKSGRGIAWNHDRGIQDGIDTLLKAKSAYGKGGEGIREYSNLVLKLVSAEDIDVAQLLQDEVAEENAKLIAQLLNGESR